MHVFTSNLSVAVSKVILNIFYVDKSSSFLNNTCAEVLKRCRIKVFVIGSKRVIMTM